MKKGARDNEGGEAKNSPESGPLGGDESFGYAPMGEVTKNTTPRPGRKSETWATRGSPSGDSGDY
jgi:hypothetical protein